MYWMKQLLVEKKQTFSRMFVLFLISNFRLYKGLKLTLKQESVCKNVFPSAFVFECYNFFTFDQKL